MRTFLKWLDVIGNALFRVLVGVLLLWALIESALWLAEL